MTASWVVFSILMAGIVLNAAYRPFTAILLLGNRPGLQTIFVGLIVSTNIAMNAVLIPKFGMYGAATATALAYLFEAALIIIVARKVFDVRL